MRGLSTVDATIYLRSASVDIFNGMVSLTFSCDGSHCMRYDEFLAKARAPPSGPVQPSNRTQEAHAY
jgi:hypothetical protein